MTGYGKYGVHNLLWRLLVMEKFFHNPSPARGCLRLIPRQEIELSISFRYHWQEVSVQLRTWKCLIVSYVPSYTSVFVMGGSMEGNPCIDASSRSPVSGEKSRTQFPSLVLKEKFGAPAPTFRLIPWHVIKSRHIITPQGQKMLISQNLLKTMLDFLFCPIQLYIELYYNEEKTRKNPKMKF